MADLFATMENIERKTGPIEEGRTLKIMNLNLDEIKGGPEEIVGSEIQGFGTLIWAGNPLLSHV